jgi:hypothetical protein
MVYVVILFDKECVGKTPKTPAVASPQILVRNLVAFEAYRA